MKILQLISPTGYYGAERWVVALANNFEPTELTCKLLILSENESQEIELQNRYPDSTNNVHRLEMKSRFDFNVITKIAQIIDEQNIDIIHSHGYKADIITLLTKRKRKLLRIVSTPHGLGVVSDLKLRLFHKLRFWSLRHFDVVAPLSPGLFSKIKDAGVPESKIRLIPNGVDLTEIDEQPLVINTQNKVKRIGYVGRLAQGKQVEEILRVFNSLWLTDNSLSLHIAGTGTELESLKLEASNLPSNEAIQFLGFVEDRFSLMRTFDLFIMTSESEGTPRSLMEALYIQIPIVAYDVEGVDQLIKHEKTGLLAPLNNLKELEEQCLRLLNDRELADEIKANGRALIENEFSARTMAMTYLSLYEEMLSDRI